MRPPLIIQTFKICEHLRVVLRLAAIDVARRAAKTRIRAATTQAEIMAVTLEIAQ